ncbi:2Fe-2S iron-sulfur cluster-binding protein [Ramlibacter sp. H39-3-26]|uniref:2Fe-2S iron-sulfur cluster-binding protein n=1 Tax=Curvibacter soli TaxID=3031331 RepID=UPI0023DB1CE1|nr:2Fe-2S iron-sulfur cluster-binding protein [Ramlibacter sp. H39-3-26]MDF1485746.1 2Fe-2S iron-sulfur cluster-binding protein [Ramlibacter sp. H39-3-26]
MKPDDDAGDGRRSDGGGARPRPWRVRVEPSGLAFDASADESLLEAAEKAGVELPSSCRNGTCRTCLCTLLEGSVRYLIAWPGLSAEEKQEGCILPCVAHAQSDAVIEQPWAMAASAAPR